MSLLKAFFMLLFSMKISLSSSIIFLIFLSLFSCKKDDGESSIPSTTKPPTTDNGNSNRCNDIVINVYTTFVNYAKVENTANCKAYKDALKVAIESDCPQIADELKAEYQVEIDNLDC